MILSKYENYIYIVDLVWFLNLKPEADLLSGEIKPPEGVNIKFENVWFKYPRTHKWIIKNANITIVSGEKLAIVGENGAGKTTLIKLLAGFYKPTKGKILIGSTNLKDINLLQWREKFAILFQQFETYPFSAKDTIGYGDIDRIDNLDEIKAAAVKSGIDEFVSELPLKYENPLAPEFEKGVNPSTGQWQRFGISRILFRKDAKYLILDEPTSNVDPEAEEKIFKELSTIAKDKILIFVTQRFSTVRISDMILVMHKGEIIEKGCHADLMKKDGKYAHLFNLQAKAYF